MSNDLKDPMSIRHKVLFGDYEGKVDEVECTCNGVYQPAAYRLYEPEGYNVVVWNNCARTLFASMKRHLAAVPLPEEKCVDEFLQFARPILDDLPLQDFDYSFTQWFNNLTTKQQQELFVGKELVTPNNRECVYDMFCKREVQLYKDGESLPKTRAIAGPQPEDKLVLGPICWALEEVMAESLEGYCGGKNWEDLEKTLSTYYEQGYTVIVQGDGSGFDRTQSHELKEIDRIIYRKVADKVHHVDRDIFETKAMSRFRKLRGFTFNDGSKKLIMNAKVDATVTSGNPDTTLMNTTRMALYIRFMAHKADIDAKFLAKGDDFVVFCRCDEDAKKLEKIFWQYWAPKNKLLNEKYGLGLVLKFLTIGDYSTFDFCSTHLICDFNRAKFKIVRQWDRILNQGAYSCKMLSMSNGDKRQHINDLANCMEAWSNKMPFYSKYVDQLRKCANGFQGECSKRKIGKSRLTLPTDGHKGRLNDKRSGFGYERDKLLERFSELSMEDNVVEQFMLHKNDLIDREQPWSIVRPLN